MRRAVRSDGFTLLELMVVTALLAMFGALLMTLLTGSLDVFRRGAEEQDYEEKGVEILALLAEDLRALHGGARGALVVDLVPLPAGGKASRVRLVRSDPGAPQGLTEVAWWAAPDRRDATGAGLVLMRAERPLQDAAGTMLVVDFPVRPPPDAVEVAAGVLHFELQVWAPTTRGWEEVGPGGPVRAWDSTRSGLLDAGLDPANASPWDFTDPASARPGLDLYPRSVRLLLTAERDAIDRRPVALAAEVGARTTQMRVNAPRRLKGVKGVKIGAEWLAVTDAGRRVTSVRRGWRDTTQAIHEAGTQVRFGRAFGQVVVPGPWREVATDG